MNQKTFLSIGECMIEMAPAQSGDYHLGFAGDTLNTAWYARACLSAEEWSVAYFTRLGIDPYSQRIREFMETNGINTRHIGSDPHRQPGLYLIDVKDGERSFTYWRGQSAARWLADDGAGLDEAIAQADVVYFSGITLAILSAERRTAFLNKLADARSQGKRVAFDPNARPKLWEALDVLRETTMIAAGISDIVLPSFDDEAFIFGDIDLETTARRYHDAGSAIVVVKNGGGPILIGAEGKMETIASLQKQPAIDTTGAGDSFNGGFLASYLKSGDIQASVCRGHELAARVVMQRGALIPMTNL